ncbi:MAG: hypothetical protein FDX18_10840 [Chlorobium sp.]|nr:MAG: hypothetical protein FDX18_10840 [Chlorobium sp.]
MRNIKLGIVVLASLLIGNVNLHAEETQNPGSKVTAAEVENVGLEELSPADTSDPGPPVTRTDLEGVRTEVAVLSDLLTQRLDRNIANSNRALLIGGTVQNRFTATTHTNKPPYTNSFAFNSFILSLSGSLKKDYDEGRSFDYLVRLTASSPSSYNLQATDAYLQYSILPSLSIDRPYLYVQFGQQKIPFGLEPLTTEDKRPTINQATFARTLNPAQQDIGIQLRGDLFPSVDLGYNYRIPFIEYNFGVFNGSGANTVDTNRSRQVAGRVAFNAPVDYNSDFRGLTLGTSLTTGNQDLYRGTTLITGGTGKASRIRFGQDISYVSSPIGFTAEYALGRDQQAISGTDISNAIKATTKSKGYTLTLFYEWGEQFVKSFRNQSRNDDWWPKTYQPFVRYDHWDPNTSVGGDDLSVVTVGFNFFFAQTTKLQLNYNITRDKGNNLSPAQGSKTDRNDFVAQFQYGF